jgi:hypothetical protein
LFNFNPFSSLKISLFRQFLPPVFKQNIKMSSKKIQVSPKNRKLNRQVFMILGERKKKGLWIPGEGLVSIYGGVID